MKRIIFITFFLLMSHESSASLMQLHYKEFYTPASLSNPPPVDMSGIVSLSFDDAVQDSDASQNSGLFANAITNGFMFLRGVQYDVDFSSATEITTTTSFRDEFKVTGSVVNKVLGTISSFFLYFGGNLSANAGQSLANLSLDCFELHLLVFDPALEVGSPEYMASLQSFENGNLSLGGVTPTATVSESSPIVLLILGLFGALGSRVMRSKK